MIHMIRKIWYYSPSGIFNITALAYVFAWWDLFYSALAEHTISENTGSTTVDHLDRDLPDLL